MQKVTLLGGSQDGLVIDADAVEKNKPPEPQVAGTVAKENYTHYNDRFYIFEGTEDRVKKFGAEATISEKMIDDDLAMQAYFESSADEFLTEEGYGGRRRVLLNLKIMVNEKDEYLQLPDGYRRVVGKFEYYIYPEAEQMKRHLTKQEVAKAYEIPVELLGGYTKNGYPIRRPYKSVRRLALRGYLKGF